MQNVADIVESNGKTVRENNTELTHKYPIGSLVKVSLSRESPGGSYIKGEAVLYVIRHERDCDGTPLYGLGLEDPAVPEMVMTSINPDIDSEYMYRVISENRRKYDELDLIFGNPGWFSGYSEESLTLVK